MRTVYFLAGLLLAGSMTEAAANGRFPATVDTRFQPQNDQRILLSTTFGLLVSEDDGDNFYWICESNVSYGGTYDPDYAVTVAGEIYASTFRGLRVSRDDGCTFEDTSFYGDPSGGSSPEVLIDPWIAEVEVASDGKVWAVTSTNGVFNNVYVSIDGDRFDTVNRYHATAGWESIRVSQSNPDVAYVTGFDSIGLGGEALLFKTDDGGQSWTDLGVSDFSFGELPYLYIEAISATDPNTLYARVLAARSPEGDDLYRSIDGGASWTKVLEMAGLISAFVLRADGSVIAGTATPCTEEIPSDADAAPPDKGCVRTSSTGAAGTWQTPDIEPKLGCLGERPADKKLFACAQNWTPDNFAYGSSDNAGDSWDKIFRIAEIAGPLECPDDTEQYVCETKRWPLRCGALGACMYDAGPPGSGAVDASPGALDGGPTITVGQGDCGCQSSGSGSLLLLVGIWLFLVIAHRRHGLPPQ